MNYFRVLQSHDLVLAARQKTATTMREAADSVERSGLDVQKYLSDFDPAMGQREHDESLRDHQAVEGKLRETLRSIREQAGKDAHAAWVGDEEYFAPVLFQPLIRQEAGWETALKEITAIGWILDSWQVIGPAPAPFGGTVTLIQTLFAR